MSKATEQARRAEVLRLRLEGQTFEAIAEATGYADRAAAYNAYQTARREQFTEPLEELRELEGDRLDALLASVWPQAMTGDLKAVNQALALIRARVSLYGLGSQPTPNRFALALDPLTGLY